MKHRDPRRKTLVQARIQHGAARQNVSILDISSRGMLMQSVTPPECGAYVEIQRGRQVIVARVVWTNHQRFGVRTQDDLIFADLLQSPSGPASAQEPAQNPDPSPSHHAAQRKHSATSAAYNRSRHLSRATEFVSIAMVGAIAATMAIGAVVEALASPMLKILTALQS